MGVFSYIYIHVRAILPPGSVRFGRGLSILTERFDPYKESLVLHAVSGRERHLERLRAAVEECRSNRPFRPSDVVESLREVREATALVVERVLEWRKGLVRPEPFDVGGVNYMLKVVKDVDGLRGLPTADLFGFELGMRNPFCMPNRPRKAVREVLRERRRKQAAMRRRGAPPAHPTSAGRQRPTRHAQEQGRRRGDRTGQGTRRGHEGLREGRCGAGEAALA